MDNEVAKGTADAELLIAEAKARSYQVEAAGKRSLNEASNLLSPDQIAIQVRMELIKNLPEIFAHKHHRWTSCCLKLA